ncbi:MAG: CNNM domain-containing protein [Gammaproteobacteria bacterium]
MSLLITYLAIAIGISFICSVLEAVLLSITPSYVERITTKDPGRGEILAKVKNRLDQSIASILILNTFAHTMGAAGVGSQAANIFGVRWETLIAVILTLVILYFSEIIPKTIGATYWRQLAIPSAHIIYWLIKLVYPLIWVSSLITKLFRKGDAQKVSREEIIALASLGHQMGSLISQENEYLTNVLKLREIRTEEILTPRSVMHSLDASMTVNQALSYEETRQFTRIPIYQDNRDNIIGLVINRDLLFEERGGKSDLPLSDFSKVITRVSENLPVQQLLDMFIKKREHMFLVEDQYGQTIGLVTLEDAIETVLGREIIDEADIIEDMQKFAKGKYRKRLRNEKSNQKLK